MLAHLGLGRGYALAGDNAKARTSPAGASPRERDHNAHPTHDGARHVRAPGPRPGGRMRAGGRDDAKSHVGCVERSRRFWTHSRFEFGIMPLEAMRAFHL